MVMLGPIAIGIAVSRSYRVEDRATTLADISPAASSGCRCLERLPGEVAHGAGPGPDVRVRRCCGPKPGCRGCPCTTPHGGVDIRCEGPICAASWDAGRTVLCAVVAASPRRRRTRARWRSRRVHPGVVDPGLQPAFASRRPCQQQRHRLQDRLETRVGSTIRVCPACCGTPRQMRENEPSQRSSAPTALAEGAGTAASW